MNCNETKKIILDQEEIVQALKSIARRIIFRHTLLSNVCLVRTRTGGAFLAGRR